jgi:hypothetical protein
LASGELIPLAQQDRSLWDRDLIAEGLELIAAAWSKRPVDEYLVQAQIAALHDQARRAEDANWREIAALYDLLERMTGNPMVSLNRAIAIAMVDGASAGLSLLEPLSEPLAGHHRLHAVRAHLLEMAGEVDAAIAEYETAASRTTSVPENHYRRCGRRGSTRAGQAPSRRSGDQTGEVNKAEEGRWRIDPRARAPALNRRRDRVPDPGHQAPREQPGKAAASGLARRFRTPKWTPMAESRPRARL